MVLERFALIDVAPVISVQSLLSLLKNIIGLMPEDHFMLETLVPI